METKKNIVYVIRDFKYKNRYLLFRNKEKISEVKKQMDNEEMVFGDITALPKKHGGRTGANWEEIFKKIPKGKYWIPKKANVQTLREAISVLEESGRIKKNEYCVTQRTENKVTTIYVMHMKPKKEKTDETATPETGTGTA